MNEHQETVARLQPDQAAAAPGSLPWYKREFKPTARVSACILIPLGVLGMWWNWHLAHSKGEYYPKIAFMSPFIIILGIYYLLHPTEDPTVLPRPIETRHWVVFALALAAGAANWYAFEYGLY